MKPWTRWQDWATVILGIFLFFTPSFFGTAAGTLSAWDAWVIGIVAVILALMALNFPDTVITEWMIAIVGAWLFISPWVLNFVTRGSETWAAWIIGVLLLVASGWVLLERSRPHAGARA